MTSTRRAHRGARNDGRRALRAASLGGLAALALAGAGAAPALAGTSELPGGSRIVVEGDVGATAVHGSTLYLGQSSLLHGLGLRAPGLAVVDSSSGSLDRSSPELVAPGEATPAAVRAVVGDGEGGAYVAGDFEGTAGVRQADLIHVRADGTVDRTFRPRFGGGRVVGFDETWHVALTDLERAPDGTLYVAGDFGSVNGQPRQGVAALDPVTGAPSGWRVTLDLDPAGREPNRVHPFVRDVAVGAGETLYLSGDFTAVGEGAQRVARAGAAQVGRADAQPTEWNPGAGFGEGAYQTPRAARLAVAGQRVYLFGEFTAAEHGAPADRLVAVDAVSGERVEGFAPAPDGPVRSLAIGDDGATVYAGGSFAAIGGEERRGLAALSAADGAATDWAPALGGAGWTSVVDVLGLELDGDTLRAVGHIGRIDGELRCHAAAIGTAADAPLRPWDPALDTVEDVDCPETGGTVEGHASVVRTIDGRTWLGGTFTKINRVTRRGLAAVDLAEDRILPWRPTLDGRAYAMTVAPDGSRVYVGGRFTAVNDVPRANLAAVTATGSADAPGDVAAWDPAPTSDRPTRPQVSALAFDARPGSAILYAGGAFRAVGAGTPRSRLAAFDPVAQPDGAPTSWDPGADDEVLGLAVARDGTVLAAGRFRTLAGAGRNYAGALAPDGASTAWDPAFPAGAAPGTRSLGLDVAVDDRPGEPGTVYVAADVEDGRGDKGSLHAWNLADMTPRAGLPADGGVLRGPRRVDADGAGGLLVRGEEGAAHLSPAGELLWQVAAGNESLVPAVERVGDALVLAGDFPGVERPGALRVYDPAARPAVETSPRISSLSLDGEERIVDGGIVAGATGTSLTCVPADAGETPAARSYEWLYDGVVQDGLTGASARVDVADVSVSCRETLRAAADAVVVQESAPVLVVSRAPENDGVLPELSGTVQVESSVRCTTGGWTAGGRVASFRYRWMVGGATVAGQSTRDYVPVAGDVGKALSCEVTASNGAGESAPARSAAKTVAAKPVERRDPPRQDPPNQDPPRQDPPVQDPPVQDPPVQQPPVEDPPRSVARPVVRKVSYSPKRGGRVTVGVRVPGAGTLRVTVRVRVGRRAVVVASGSLKVRKAGTVTLRLTPSKAGRKALRRARGRRLVAVAVFTAAR